MKSCFVVVGIFSRLKMAATKSISSLLLVDSSSSCFFSPIPRFLTLRIATTTTLRSTTSTLLRRAPSRRSLTSSLAVMFPDNSVLSDVCASGITSVVAVSCLGFWGEIGKRGIFDQVIQFIYVHLYGEYSL